MTSNLVRPAELLQEAVQSFREIARIQNVELKVEDHASAQVGADPEAIHQVFSNLVDNALKYANSGGRIVLGARPVSGGVEFYVQDFGPGIPSEHLPRLFERFYRVDKARSRESGGTGLGLAIAKHIVLAHGGSSAPRANSTTDRSFCSRSASLPSQGGLDWRRLGAGPACRGALPPTINLQSVNQTLKKTAYAPVLTIHNTAREERRQNLVRPVRVASGRNVRMSTAILRSPEPESPYAYLVKRTIEACGVAKEAAATAAEGIATASSPLLNTLREREKELDRLDMEIDAGVTQIITQVTECRGPRTSGLYEVHDQPGTHW